MASGSLGQSWLATEPAPPDASADVSRNFDVCLEQQRLSDLERGLSARAPP
jgi:hypothetical protein